MSSNLMPVGWRPLKVVVDDIIVCVIYGSVALTNRDVLIPPKFCPGILAKFYREFHQYQSMRNCRSSLKTSKNCERDS